MPTGIDKDAGVAGEAGRITGDIDHPALFQGRDLADLGFGTGAGGIEDDGVHHL